MSKLLSSGDNHPSRKFVGCEVDIETYFRLRKMAEADQRSVSSMLRKILSAGDNHPEVALAASKARPARKRKT